MSDPQFKLGDFVEWTSQAGGHEKTKRGRVVFVHPHGERMLLMFRGKREVGHDEVDEAVRRGWLEPRIAEDLKASFFQRRCDYFGPIVVAVARRSRRNAQRLSPAIYSPRAKHLRVVEDSG